MKYTNNLGCNSSAATLNSAVVTMVTTVCNY